MNLISILPELLLFCGALIILMIDIFLGKKLKNPSRIAFLTALIFSISALAATILAYDSLLVTFNNMIFDNRFTSLVKVVTLGLLIAVVFMSDNFVKAESRISAEFLALIMIAAVGSMILISANDLLPFYMALELQSLPLYILATIKRQSSKSSESGMKYFILGAVSSGILLFGISMIYGFSGTTNFSAIYNILMNNHGSIAFGVMFGFVLVLIAMLFKTSAVPFHMWTPDVYEGSTTIVGAFFASMIKFVSMIVLARIYLNLASIWVNVNQILILVAILSLLVGCLGAIKQDNLKRMFAYSSIGHIGFILAGLAAINVESIKAAILYMIIYSTLALGAFAFLMLLISKSKIPGQDLDQSNDHLYKLSSIAGIAKTNPLIALCLAILMFSMAGIPPMAGFFTKFYILLGIIKQQFYYLAVIAVLTSVISAFYYLRIIKIIYFDNQHSDIQINSKSNAAIILLITALISLLFISYMKPLLSLIAGIF